MSLQTYECMGRAFQIRWEAAETKPCMEDQSAIHENWLGDPYRLAGMSQIVVDVGGNIGAFALRALAEGAHQVLCYEPEPDNISVFKANCAKEIASGHIFLTERAVWSATGEIVGLEPAKGNTFVSDPGQVRVPTISLNDILLSVDRVALLKVDIEGSEHEAFSTCSLEALQRVDRLAMEYHHPDQAGWWRMLQRILTVFDVEMRSNGTNEDASGMLWGRHK